MGLCSNLQSYDSINDKKDKHGQKYSTGKGRKERSLAKKSLRKYSRAMANIVIEEYLMEIAETEEDTARLLAETAVEIRWGLEHVIDMFEAYNVISPAVRSLAERDYAIFMENVELY